jgi:hypothetical protein
MNRRLAFVVVTCMIVAMLLMAAGPVPEKPMTEGKGTISCQVTKEGTSDLKDKAHDTNWGQKELCTIKAPDVSVAGTLVAKNLWSEFNKNQKGAGFEVQTFHLTTKEGKWEGYFVTRADKEGKKYVNGWGHGQSAPYQGQKIWFRISEDGVIQYWVSQHGEDSLHSDKHPGGG